jgi:hypothetical protein
MSHLSHTRPDLAPTYADILVGGLIVFGLSWRARLRASE